MAKPSSIMGRVVRSKTSKTKGGRLNIGKREEPESKR